MDNINNHGCTHNDSDSIETEDHNSIEEPTQMKIITVLND